MMLDRHFFSRSSFFNTLTSSRTYSFLPFPSHSRCTYFPTYGRLFAVFSQKPMTPDSKFRFQFEEKERNSIIWLIVHIKQKRFIQLPPVVYELSDFLQEFVIIHVQSFMSFLLH